MHEAGTEALEQLALAEDDRQLVARAAGDVAGALGGRARAHELYEQTRTAREQGSADGNGDREEGAGKSGR